tara:strand:- start:249 stop:488 length:240 start_codon:yes stop_codon:yes gene_type:complete
MNDVHVGSVGTVPVSGQDKLVVKVTSRQVSESDRKRGRRPTAVVSITDTEYASDKAFGTVYLNKAHVATLVAALKAAVA